MPDGKAVLCTFWCGTVTLQMSHWPRTHPPGFTQTTSIETFGLIRANFRHNWRSFLFHFQLPVQSEQQAFATVNNAQHSTHSQTGLCLCQMRPGSVRHHPLHHHHRLGFVVSLALTKNGWNANTHTKANCLQSHKAKQKVKQSTVRGTTVG